MPIAKIPNLLSVLALNLERDISILKLPESDFSPFDCCFLFILRSSR